MNPIINRIFAIHDKAGSHKRKVTGEFFQYSQRIYNLVDLETKEKHTALAETFDKMFCMVKGSVNPNKRAKGKTIGSKQKVY
jgi:hypothetical protein